MRAIKTERAHQLALDRAFRLMNALPGSDEDLKLQALAVAIEKYEKSIAPVSDEKICDICKQEMPKVGYGNQTCPHCGAEWEWQEHVALVMDEEMQALVTALVLAILMWRKTPRPPAQ